MNMDVNMLENFSLAFTDTAKITQEKVGLNFI